MEIDVEREAERIDEQVRRACADLATAGATLLNQSVLLAGVNDSATTLAQLSESLLAARVLPYYLHLLDKVQGAAHFDVDERREEREHERVDELLEELLPPGLLRGLGQGVRTETRAARLHLGLRETTFEIGRPFLDDLFDG